MKKKTNPYGKRKKKKISCLELSQFQFLDICVLRLLLLCIDYYQWITVQKRPSECFLFHSLYFKAKKFFKSREIGGLVVCGYDGISVFLKEFLRFTFFLHQIQRQKLKYVTVFCQSSDSDIFLSANHLGRPGSNTNTEIYLR